MLLTGLNGRLAKRIDEISRRLEGLGFEILEKGSNYVSLKAVEKIVLERIEVNAYNMTIELNRDGQIEIIVLPFFRRNIDLIIVAPKFAFSLNNNGIIDRMVWSGKYFVSRLEIGLYPSGVVVRVVLL